MWWFVACEDEERERPSPEPVPDVVEVDPLPWEIDTAIPVGSLPCDPDRDVDFAAWPGGARMRLDVEPFGLGDPLTVWVTGADPGETVELYAGALCSLDCPQLDGGCFQPAAATQLATWITDDLGSASGEVVPPGDLVGGWTVLQATAPNAAVRYVSQPMVDHTGSALGPPRTEVVHPVGPATIRGIRPLDEAWTFLVPPGRRARVTVHRDDTSFYATRPELLLTNSGVITSLGTVYGDLEVEQDHAVPTRYTLWTSDTDEFNYNVDFALLVLHSAVPWYTDEDADGHGDPARVLMTSTVPVAGASADPTDCDDGDPAVHPIAVEVCDDGIDQDCDGMDRPCVGLGPIGTSGTQVRGTVYEGVGGTLHAADLDGDGVDELLVGSEAPGGATVRRVNRGEVTVLVEGGASNDVFAEDFDGDGAPELGVIRDGRTALLMDLDDAVPQRSLTALEFIELLEAADVTGDGVPELLASTSFGAIGARLSVFADPLGAATVIDTLALGSGGVGHAADFDGDGISDWLDAAGCLWPGPVPFDAWAWCEGVTAAIPRDVDADGTPDVIGGEDDTLTVRRLGSDAPWATLEVGVAPTELAWLVDRDGSDRSWVAIREATGTATYVEPITGPGVWDGHRGMLWMGATAAAGDFDGDGAFDLALGRGTVSYATEPSAGEVWISWSAFDAVP